MKIILTFLATFFLGTISCACANAQQSMPLLGAGGAFRAVAPAGYTGVGDIISLNNYWSLRCYNTAYAGNVADIWDGATGSTTETLLTCSSGGTINQTINSLATTCAVACNVKTLYNQVSVGTNDCTQATLANQPTLILNLLGSRFGIQVDSSVTGKWLACGTLALAQPYTIVQATNVTTLTAAFTAIWDSNAAVGGQAGRTGTANTYRLFCPTVIGVAANDNTWHAIQSVCNGASSNARIDGTDNIAAGGATALAGTFTLFSDAFHGTDGYIGNAFEFGIIASSPSAGNLTSINSNIHTYWGF